MKHGRFLADIKYANEQDTETIFIPQEQFTQSEKQRLFTEYFNNPIMTKTEDDNNCSHYYAKVNISLLSESRYLIVIVNRDDQHIGKRTHMTNLNWRSLQTRCLRDNKNIKSFSYTKGLVFLDVVLTITNKTKSYTEYYNSDLDISVFVFHTKQHLSYPDNVSLYSAIETYQTIIN